MKKKDYLYMFILLIIPLILVYFFVSDGKIFGNTVDWFNQHVMISDTLRHTIRNEGTLFPTYLSNLMNGINIYHFSYYGYLRPDIILGALFIQVEMIDIIIAYSIFCMILSALSCYLFLRYQNKNKEICLFVSILVILSSIFFQSHKQIMFVNYMPFLFLALFSIDIYLKKKQLTPFVISGVFIVLHSYYYSIGCFLICMIYFVYKCRLLNKHITKLDFFQFIKGFVLIVLITAILTIPTLFVIASNSKSVSSIDYLSLFDMSFDLKGLLYNNYGCGFTYLVWILIVLGLHNSKTRVLSAVTMLAMLLPFISFVFNGFLYARSKILIVFIPLVAYIVCEMLDNILHHKLEWDYFSVFLIIIPIIFIKNPFFAIIDVVICILLYLAKYYIKKIYFIYLLIPLLVVYFNNPASSFLEEAKYQNIMNNDKTSLLERNIENITRLGDLESNHQNVNNNYYTRITKSSGYTSTNHSLYNQFLYDTLRLPISINNRVANQDDAHIFYLGMMSVDTLITKDKKTVGYSLIDQQKKYKLYQSQDVMPIAYASHNLYNEKQFTKLNFPQTLDTLYNNVIVKNGNGNYQSQFVSEDLGFKNSYHIQNKKKKMITKTVNRTYQNEILVIEFDVKNNKPNNSVEITINGVKNKLSTINTPYYNDNTHFTYVLSDEDIIEKLQITLSKGDYLIENISCSSLNYEVIKNRSHEVDIMHKKNNKDILNGDINVSHDGYFITNIPYDKGYTIYIDNKKVKTEIVNTAFLGCPIKSGYHQIKITFQPRGYSLALCISTLGITLTIFNFIYERKNKDEK